MRKKFRGALFPALILGLALALSAPPARAQLTKQPFIRENLKSGQGNNTQTVIDKPGASNEATLRMVAPASGGTGFRWGAYASSTVADAMRILENHDAGFGTFITLAYNPGQYFYTIFSSNGNGTPDQYVDLSGANAAFTYNIFSNGGLSTPAFKIRFLIRTNSGAAWYVSSPVDVASPVPSATTAYSTPVKPLTWYAVTSAVTTNLNKLADKDEVALAYATTASTPDLTKVDGGGWVLDAGKVSTVQEKSFKMTRLTFNSGNPYIAAVPSAAYSTVPNQLVLGRGVTTGKMTLTNGNNAFGDLTINSITVNSPDGRITASPAPTVPTTLNTNSLDVNIAFNQNGTQQTTASLTISYSYTGGSDTVTFPILGRGVIDGTIKESFVLGNANMAAARDTLPNETPQTMIAPLSGTGFCWGGYTNAHSNTGNRDQVGISNQRLCFYGAQGDDANTGGAYHGSYAYTIFDTLTNGATYDRTVNLHKFQYYCDNIPTGTQLRWLVRDDQNRWFMSKNTIAMTSEMVNKLTSSDVDDLTQGWLRVDQTAEDRMNALATTKATPAPQTPINDAGSLTAGTPNLAKVTGAGVYVEVGNTDPNTNTPLTFWDLNFLARPSNGDTLKITSTAKTESYKVPNRRLALAGLSFDITSGLDAALDGVDVTVAPNTTGLRSVVLYSDPNGDGNPTDGAELTNCTLDASAAHLSFRDNTVFTAGTSTKMVLMAMTDETGTSKTYTMTITPAQWKQDTENGGTGDTIVSAPSPITASIVAKTASIPDTANLLTSPIFKETWNGTTAGAIPNTPATGTIAGADSLWNYTWGATNNALIASKNSSLALGNETYTMTTEPPYNGSLRLDASLNTLFEFDAATTIVTRLKFDVVITSTSKSTSPARLSGRVVAEQSNIDVTLRDYSGSSAYDLTIFPLLDAERYMFGIRYNTFMYQYAPGNIVNYSSNNGLGTYQYTVYLSPYNAYSTLARVQVKHVESNKTLDWTTVIDGIIANMSNLRVAFGAYPNAYIDNVDVTNYVYHINPVKSWATFE